MKMSPEAVSRWRKYRAGLSEVVKAKRYRDGHLKIYGLNSESYDVLFTAQHGLCAICGLPEVATMRGKVKRLAVDHRHSDDKVRGLVCSKCNTAIGLLDEDPKKFEAAMLYLERTNA